MQFPVPQPEPIESRPQYAASAKTFPSLSDLAQPFCQWAMVIFLAAVIYLVISRFILQVVQVQGQSMMPTLQNDDRCFLNRWTYYMHSPQRGDVVVLKDPSDGDYAVKRVIGLTGDAVHIKGGLVYLNGRELKEPYLASRMPTTTCSRVNEELILCGQNQYFVLGDNRVNSFDSRIYGPVPRRNIVGALIR